MDWTLVGVVMQPDVREPSTNQAGIAGRVDSRGLTKNSLCVLLCSPFKLGYTVPYVKILIHRELFVMLYIIFLHTYDNEITDNAPCY